MPKKVSFFFFLNPEQESLSLYTPLLSSVLFFQPSLCIIHEDFPSGIYLLLGWTWSRGSQWDGFRICSGSGKSSYQLDQSTPGSTLLSSVLPLYPQRCHFWDQGWRMDTSSRSRTLVDHLVPGAALLWWSPHSLFLTPLMDIPILRRKQHFWGGDDQVLRRDLHPLLCSEIIHISCISAIKIQFVL